MLLLVTKSTSLLRLIRIGSGVVCEGIARVAKSITLHFGTSYTALSSVQLAIGSADRKEYFILKLSKSEFHWRLFKAGD